MIHSDLDMAPDQYKNLYFLPLESQPTRLRTYRMFGPLSVRLVCHTAFGPRDSPLQHNRDTSSLDNTPLSDDGLLQAKH